MRCFEFDQAQRDKLNCLIREELSLMLSIVKVARDQPVPGLLPSSSMWAGRRETRETKLSGSSEDRKITRAKQTDEGETEEFGVRSDWGGTGESCA